VGDAEGFARDAVEEVAFDGFGRREGDGVHQAVEAVPALAEFEQASVDLLVAATSSGNGDVAVEFGGKLLDAVDRSARSGR
jgi:acyl-CoA synthetase (NDP forming)